MRAYILPLTLLLLALLAAGSAQATDPRPPPAVVIQMTSVTSWGGAAAGFAGNYNVTFLLSPDDPDQINGAYNYSEFLSGASKSAITQQAVPNRPGWVYYTGGLNVGNTDAVRTVNITADDGSTPPHNESIQSCTVTVDLRTTEPLYFDGAPPHAHDQCGVPVIRTPTGVSAATLFPLNETGGRVDVRWRLSRDDPNQDDGNFTYNVFQTVPGEQLELLGEDPLTPEDTGGVRVFTHLYTEGGAPFSANFSVLAVDPLTRQWSNFTCRVLLNNGVQYEQNACGDLPIPGIGPGYLDDDGPSWPLLNVPDAAESFGLETVTFAYILGGGGIMAGIIGGFVLAGPIGAVVGGAGALGFITVLNLFPVWIMILVFIAIAAGIVLTLSGGGGRA